MGSRKNEATGISLLSMYNDEDDEMEDAESESEDEVVANEEGRLDKADLVMGDEEEGELRNERNVEGATESNHDPQQHVMKDEQLNDKNGSLNFVDYGHDEVAMSPEAVKEGDIPGAGQDNQDFKLPDEYGVAQEKDGAEATNFRLSSNKVTLEATSVHIRTSLIASHDEDMHDISGVKGTDDKNQVDKDPLDLFLPPPPVVKCSQELQDKINKFLALKKSGKSFNKEVRNKKAYRNPDFLLHAVTYQEIDQIGSCFSKDVFDPHGYDTSDFYDEIEADMKRELERKEQERKKNNKLEFTAGGVQPAMVLTSLKPTLPSPVSNIAVGGTSSLEAVPREGRQNKKSKWDKVDGEQGAQFAVGQDSRTAVVGAFATRSSANNAGAGYTAFAQQRRKEAEEKKSSERRRSRS